MNKLSDEQLMEEFKDTHNQQCIAVIVKRYTSRSLAIAAGFTGDYHNAQDSVQETFIRIVQNSDKYCVNQPFAPWFFRILRNVCLDYIRRQKAYTNVLDNFSFVDQQDSCSGELSKDITALLQKVPEKERQVLILKLNAEMNLEEIASVCGCSVEAAKKRAQRGMKHLRDLAVKNQVLESVYEPSFQQNIAISVNN